MTIPVADPVRMASRVPVGGGMASPAPQAATPPPPPPPTEADEVWMKIVQQESGGRPGLIGPDTPYGNAEGETQMLPETAKATAAKLGIPWHPELMTGTSKEAEDYQLKLGRAYFDEGLQKYGGDTQKAAAYYYGGPDEKKWGPKTHGYVASVTGKGGGAAGTSDEAARNKVLGEIDSDAQAADKSDKELKAFVKGHMDRQAALEAEIEAIKYPTTPTLPETPKPPKAVQTQPLDVMRQFLPVIAALGGLRSRAPATAVMNAMAAAVEARQKNDKEAFSEANTEFKNQLDVMHDMWSMQREKFLDAFNNTKASVEDRLAALRVEALRMGDAKLLDDIDHSRLDEAYKKLTLLDTAHYHTGLVAANMEKAKLTSELNAQKLEQQRVYEKAIGDLKKTPEYQQAEPYQQALKEADVARSLMPNYPFKIAQLARQARQDISKSGVGKAYESAVTFMPTILTTSGKLKNASMLKPWDNPVGSQEQAAFLDAYTKLVTGGQAIRGFTLKMNTDHAGILDKASVLGQSIGKGGPLSVRQMKEMVEVSEAYADTIQKLHEQAVSKAESVDQGLGASEGMSTPFEAGALESEMSSVGASAGGHKPGDIVTGGDGKQYRVIGGDPNDPDVEPVG